MNAPLLARILVLSLPLALFGCGHGHDHDGDDSHEHGDEHSHEAADEHDGEVETAQVSDDSGAVWSCPMHPEITASEAGRCSKCNMFLTRPDDDHGHEHGEGSGHDEDEHGHEHGDGEGHDKDQHSHDEHDEHDEHDDGSHEH